ncbi:hypothetical protein ACWDBD_36720 [Streptomyces sp. NPDC001118]
MSFTFGPVTLADAGVELRPVFDPAQRLFNVQVWRGNEPVAIHGLTEEFEYADDAAESIGEFLAEHGIRDLTGEELITLYGGLLKAEGGVDYQLFAMQVARSQQL